MFYSKIKQFATFNENKTIREIVLDENILDEEEVNKLLNHEAMIKSKK